MVAMSVQVPQETPRFHACPLDQAPCDVVAKLPVGADMASCVPLLPCSRCRIGAAEAEKLSLRLGKHERRILLAATRPDARAPALVLPLAPSSVSGAKEPARSAYEMNRHAMRNLERNGLILTSRPPRPLREGGRPRLAAQLTALGAALVDRLREELLTGRSIRWSRHRTALAAAIQKPPDELVEILTQTVESERRKWARWSSVSADLRQPGE
jgi:hypothetical protein